MFEKSIKNDDATLKITGGGGGGPGNVRKSTRTRSWVRSKKAPAVLTKATTTASSSTATTTATTATTTITKSKDEKRNDTIEKRKMEANDEREPEQKNNHKSVLEKMKPLVDGSSGSIFGGSGGDKKQKKVIYKEFTDNPAVNLTIVTEEQLPEPIGDRDVVIKIQASTVSYTDCMIRKGICFNVINPLEFPATPGGDVAGNIVKVGKKVGLFKVGDRVAALVRTGGNARYITVCETDLVEVPRSCDSAEAVCMVSTYMTAYQALRLVTKDNFTLNGKRVLVTGGIEPVGQALIQLCFRAGAETVFATAPMHRHRYIKSVLGAQPLPIHPKDWLPSTKGGMDVVFDGTCHDNLESPYASLKTDGILVSVGMSALLAREKPGMLGAPLSAYWARLKGQFFSNIRSYEVWESFTEDKDAFKMDLEVLFYLLKKKFIKPHIAKRIALSEVPEAQASLEQENTRGEIVCLPWKRDSKK